MIAFHGKQDVKDFYVKRVRGHILADEVVKGHYWENNRGCGVGCTIHGSNHAAYEIELGIPEWLARVEDRLFEGMTLEKAKQWPGQFLEAINPGSDLEKVKGPFLIFILESALKTFDHSKYPKIKDSIHRIIEGWQSNWENDNAASAAHAAANAAYANAAVHAAAYAAANAAVHAAANAAAAASDAAYAAAYANAAASDAAYAASASDAASASASDAAYAAASDAAYAASASDAAYAASASDAAYANAASSREKEYEKFADKLLELLRSCS